MEKSKRNFGQPNTIITSTCCVIGAYLFHFLLLYQNHTNKLGKPRHVLPQRVPIIIYKIICIASHLYLSEEKCDPCHQIFKVVYDPKFKEENEQTPKIKTPLLQKMSFKGRDK